MSIVKHVFVSLTTCAEQLPESITFVTAPGSFIVRATAMNLIRVLLMLALLFTPQVRASNESDKVVMQLNWTHAFQFAGYYAAKEQGYYREAGLDVEFREGGPGIDVLQQVTQGEAQFGVGNSSLLLARQQGKPVVVLGVIFQHSPLVLIGRQDLGIHSLSDLIGKRVMIESHSDELFAYLLLRGVTEFVNLTDVINQTNLVEDIDAKTKLGQPMLNATLFNDWGTLDFIIMPWFRERTFPGVSGRLRFAYPVKSTLTDYEPTVPVL